MSQEKDSYRRVVCQIWLEGDGSSGIADGYSLHKDHSDREEFVRSIVAMVTKVYSTWSVTGFYDVMIDESLYKKVCQSETGIRFYDEVPRPTNQW